MPSPLWSHRSLLYDSRINACRSKPESVVTDCYGPIGMSIVSFEASCVKTLICFRYDLDFVRLGPVIPIAANRRMRSGLLPRSFYHQISLTVSRCFGALRQLRSMCRYISASVFQSLMAALFLKRLDFGNSLYVGLPANQLSRLPPPGWCSVYDGGSTSPTLSFAFIDFDSRARHLQGGRPDLPIGRWRICRCSQLFPLWPVVAHYSRHQPPPTWSFPRRAYRLSGRGSFQLLAWSSGTVFLQQRHFLPLA